MAYEDVEWMTHVDKEILDFFAERQDMEVTTGVVARNIRRDKTGVSRHLGRLSKAGLVASIDDRGWYASTEAGVAFARGNVDESAIEDLNELDF